MKTTQTNTKYVEWLNAETMYKNSIEWLSDLEFMKDEQLFFDDLIKSYTLQLIDSKYFKKSKKIIDTLSKLQTKTDLFIKYVKNHKNDLKIMVDGINQPKEEADYKNEHRRLIVEINNFVKEYREVKTNLFSVIKIIMKEEKLKKLIIKK
ncbi:hypothetical protein [Pontimicrobium sp. SW4]|uniref:Uncharacterized protein n=1 Tax=Pontimicrobium sp. SW4 TaxID=3153519 RepID=A0AAU7BWM7_9FLAO